MLARYQRIPASVSSRCVQITAFSNAGQPMDRIASAKLNAVTRRCAIEPLIVVAGDVAKCWRKAKRGIADLVDINGCLKLIQGAGDREKPFRGRIVESSDWALVVVEIRLPDARLDCCCPDIR